MAKIKGSKKPEPFEHPDDSRLRIEGEQYARDRGSEFCEKYRTRLDKLVCVYPDADAQVELDSLRELFWARMWESEK